MDFRHAGNPEPFTRYRARLNPRPLTAEERIEARHWLQQLAEQARTARDAMDPVHGVRTVTAGAWDEQWESLRRELDAFTARVRANKPSAGGVGDRNA